MSKYHVNSRGAVEICRAEDGNCPFGEFSIHSEDKTTVQKFADKSNQLELEYFNIVKSEPYITANLESKLPDHVYLVGKEFRTKSLSSTKRKVLMGNKYKSCKELNDLVRYTAITTNHNFSKDSKKLIEELSKDNNIISTDLKWDSPYEYKGFHIKLQDKESGTKWELQIHTDESFQAKTEAHVLYEKERHPDTPMSERRAIHEQQEDIFQKVTEPNLSELKEFLKNS